MKTLLQLDSILEKSQNHQKYEKKKLKQVNWQRPLSNKEEVLKSNHEEEPIKLSCLRIHQIQYLTMKGRDPDTLW